MVTSGGVLPGWLDAAFSLAGTSVPAIGGDTQQVINFGAEVASVAIGAGNYDLLTNGANGFSLYIDGPIVNPSLSFCPCESAGEDELALRTYTDNSCVKIGSQIAGNVTDTGAGTILTIGGVFDSDNSSGSVCSLTETGITATRLISEPVNAAQQADCADYTKVILDCTL